jgi:hypothetical protein
MKLPFSAGTFVLLAAFALSVAAAKANPTATITSKNNWTTTAVYSSPSGCTASTVTPPFANILAGRPPVTNVAKGSFPSVFSCSIQYTSSTKFCRFVVSRLSTVNPITGAVTWNYPQVAVTTSGGASCPYVFTSVSDTGAVVTSTNGAFSVTLTDQ